MRITVNLIISCFIIFGGIPVIFADSMSFDHGTYQIEHSGTISLFLDSDPQTNPIPVTITIDGVTSEADVKLWRIDGTNNYSSELVKFTSIDPDGLNQIHIPSGANFPEILASAQGQSAIATVNSENCTFLTQANCPSIYLTYKIPKQTFSVSTDPCLGLSPAGDDDGDGICNAWENGGDLEVFLAGTGLTYTYTCDPSRNYSNDPLGRKVCPDRNKPDIYYEIDSMIGHEPDMGALQQIVKAFANAPYAVGGSTGINLHLIVDDIDLPHVDQIRVPGSTRDLGYDQYKKIWYGNSTERIDPNWDTTKTLKNYVFRYFIFIHDQKGGASQAGAFRAGLTSSGSSEIPGNDGVVSLGSWEGSVGTIDQQAGTFMHEIGHNLGLDHGGNDDVNCKPNYLSLMSYSRQMITPILPTRDLDFSNKTDPNTIYENMPGTMQHVTSTGTNEIPIVYGDNAGNYHNELLTGEEHDFGEQDLNFINVFGCSSDEILAPLNSNDDWTNIQLVAFGTGNWKDGVDEPSPLISTEEDNAPKITNIQLKGSPLAAAPSHAAFPKFDCVDRHGANYKSANFAEDRICIIDEFTHDDYLNTFGSSIDSSSSEISAISDNDFNNGNSDKIRISKQLDLIKKHISDNDMSSAYQQTLVLQKWVDGKGNDDLIKDQKSREKIYNITTDILKAQSTAIPEFDALAVLILVISIVSVVVITRNSKLRMSVYPR